MKNTKKHTYSYKKPEYKKPDRREFHRGDMYWVDMKGTDGNMFKRRPAVIISNDKCNKHSESLTVIPLTSLDEHSRVSEHLPTHVNIMGVQGVKSCAKCEHIAAVEKRQVYEFIRPLREKEIREITFAACVQIGVF